MLVMGRRLEEAKRGKSGGKVERKGVSSGKERRENGKRCYLEGTNSRSYLK